MSQITFNYPAMLAHAGEMNTYSGVLTALGADLAAQQASLQAAWHGDTSMSQAAWQAQWNTAMEEADPRLPRDGLHPRNQHLVDERPRHGRRRQMGRINA